MKIKANLVLDHDGDRKPEWTLTFGRERILETGSSVAVLKKIKSMGLRIPEIMAGPTAWSENYTVTWSPKSEGKAAK